MDKVPAWPVVRDKAQVSGGRGNMKCHLQIHSEVTHREGHYGRENWQKSSLLMGETIWISRVSQNLNTNLQAFFMKSECPGLDQWRWRQRLFWGQLPVSCLVAGQVLRQHLCKFSAFARIWSGFTWWLVTRLPPPLLFPSVPPPPPTAAPLSSLSLHSSRHNGWQTLVISRYSGPGGSGFPLVRRLCCLCIFMA